MMFEMAIKYSSDNYFEKEELQSQIDSHLFFPIWENIIEYRKLFQLEFHYQSKTYHMYHVPFVTQMMMQTYESMLQFQLSKDNDFFIPKSLPFRVQRKIRSQTMCYPKIAIFNLQQMVYHWLQLYCPKKPLIVNVSNQTKHSSAHLVNELFFLCFESDEGMQYFLLILILERYHLVYLLESLYQIIINYSKTINFTNKDVTKNFLSFLACVRFHFTKDVITLESNEVQLRKKSLEELQLCYPTLQKKQLQFYIAHSTDKQYYTIKHYMQYHNVCYETARTSLEELTALQWYQKKKIGKRFVYYV